MRGARWLLLFLLSSIAGHAFAMQEPAAVAEPPAPRVGLVTMRPYRLLGALGHNAILIDDGARRTLTLRLLRFRTARSSRASCRAACCTTVALRWRPIGELAYDGAVAVLQARPAAGQGARAGGIPGVEPRCLRTPSTLHTSRQLFDLVRDALDRALDGALKRDLSGRSHGYTFATSATAIGYLPGVSGIDSDSDLHRCSMSRWDETSAWSPARCAARFPQRRRTRWCAREVELLPHSSRGARSAAALAWRFAAPASRWRWCSPGAGRSRAARGTHRRRDDGGVAVDDLRTDRCRFARAVGGDRPCRRVGQRERAAVQSAVPAAARRDDRAVPRPRGERRAARDSARGCTLRWHRVVPQVPAVPPPGQRRLDRAAAAGPRRACVAAVAPQRTAPA